MKVIDLLNKMANGERLPNKIKLDDKIWTCKEDKKYYNQCEIELIDWYGNELQRCLNDYLELIEDEIDIDNIEEINRTKATEQIFTYTGKEGNKSNCYFLSLFVQNDVVDKINELVRETNQMKKEIKELEELNIEINEKDINEAINKAREQLNKEIKSIKEK